MQRGNFLTKLIREERIVTVSLIALIAGTFLVGWILRTDFARELVFSTATSATKPWQLITYVFVSTQSLIGVLFSSLWLWNIGSILERDLGAKKYLAVLAIYAVLAALMLWAGSILTHLPGILIGMWGVLSCITVIWGSRYPEATILVMCVLPVKAKWLALVSIGLVFFASDPKLALFAAAPLVLAWLFGKNKLPVAYGTSTHSAKRVTKTRSGMPTSPEFLADVRRREQEREERERLRKLFESGMIDNEK